ncbi:uncharacterized protein L969DRAFT_101132 [Mixia osmundae IAM 14324]|uniref:Large ribosomal subunit protein uL6 alpha-beta domain-containing protein n=1 Tax=Mixia osmundae (strain CBS 9802 / IAM 14324 / JCM 22182 / KY 12970) TaxID=764103 RepID=G7E7B1_MIXOS|nr:uncharacterized protein L969DRAFT_101132 [Mixia osmundae IAM 14324]KEI42689.1 hypothetical protein L969DRAFT_101132 [Mixia osmundae IAM 14324]GAA98721.1 hypothetical protein E5Q_05409 [Mixia osmundae IAM 14324]
MLPCTCRALRVRLRAGFSKSATARSHVGKDPVEIPPGISFSIRPLPDKPSAKRARMDLAELAVTGPKGIVNVEIASCVTLRVGDTVLPNKTPKTLSPANAGSTVQVEIAKPAVKYQRGVWGLTRMLIYNAIRGVTVPFTREIELVGVGYRVTLEPNPKSDTGGQQLTFRLGYPNPFEAPLPPGMTAEVLSPTRVVITSVDNHLLGEYAANIRRQRPPEPYRGKGVFVHNGEKRDTIKRKDIKKK